MTLLIKRRMSRVLLGVSGRWRCFVQLLKIANCVTWVIGDPSLLRIMVGMLLILPKKSWIGLLQIRASVKNFRLLTFLFW